MAVIVSEESGQDLDRPRRHASSAASARPTCGPGSRARRAAAADGGTGAGRAGAVRGVMAYHPFRHLGLKFLSIALAGAIWLTVGDQRAVERHDARAARVPQRADRPRADGEPARHASKCGCAARPAPLGRLLPGEVVAVLDLTAARSGTRLFHLLADEVRVPYGVQVSQVNPAVGAADVRAVATKRTVPVVPVVDGEPAPGYRVGRIQSSPEQVTVIGPTSHVVGVDERDHRAGVGRQRHRHVVDRVVDRRRQRTGAARPAAERHRVGRDRAGRRGQARSSGVPVAAARARRRPLGPRSTPASRGRGPARRRARRLAPLDDAPTAYVDVTGLAPGRYDLPVKVDPIADVQVAARRAGDGRRARSASARAARDARRHEQAVWNRWRAWRGRRAAARPGDGGAPRRGARARAAASRRRPHAGRPRHARVGRLDRAGAGARRRQPGRAARLDRHRADAGGRLPDRLARLRRRPRHLGVAQSVSGQRHQGVLRATAQKFAEAQERDDRGAGRRSRLPRRSRRRRRRSTRRGSRRRLSRRTRGDAAGDPARCAARASASTAPTARPTTVAPRLFRDARLRRRR